MYLPAAPRPRANQFPVGDFTESVKSGLPDGGKLSVGDHPLGLKTVFRVIPGVIVKVEPSLFFSVPIMFAPEYLRTYAPFTGCIVLPLRFGVE
jgi:hypothetical protein